MYYKKILLSLFFNMNFFNVSGSCQNMCGFKAKEPTTCYCDEACYFHQDCCIDICICNYTNSECEFTSYPPLYVPPPPSRPLDGCIDVPLNLNQIFSQYLNSDQVNCETLIWFIELITGINNKKEICYMELSELNDIFNSVFDNFIWVMPGSSNDNIIDICRLTCYNYGLDSQECYIYPPLPPPPPPPSPP